MMKYPRNDSKFTSLAWTRVANLLLWTPWAMSGSGRYIQRESYDLHADPLVATIRRSGFGPSGTMIKWHDGHQFVHRATGRHRWSHQTSFLGVHYSAQLVKKLNRERCLAPKVNFETWLQKEFENLNWKKGYELFTFSRGRFVATWMKDVTGLGIWVALPRGLVEEITVDLTNPWKWCSG